MIVPDLKGYYRTLGINRGASPAVVKRAFRTRAKQTHPDVGGDEAAFREVTRAYEVLGDRKQRAAYDASCRAVADSRQQASAKSHRDVAEKRASGRAKSPGPIDLFWLSNGQIYASASMLATGFLFGVVTVGSFAGLAFGFAAAAVVWQAFSIATQRVEKAASGSLLDDDVRSYRVSWAVIKAVLFAVSVVVYLSVIKSLGRTAPSWVEMLVWFTWPLEWLAALVVPLPLSYQADVTSETQENLLPIARHLFIAPWVLISAYLALQTIQSAPEFVIRRYLAIFGVVQKPIGSSLFVSVLLIFNLFSLCFFIWGFAKSAAREHEFLVDPTIDGIHDVAVSSFLSATLVSYCTLAVFSTVLVLAIRASYHLGPGVNDRRVVAAMSSASSLD